MGTANIDALVAEIAAIKESLRIKNQSLANINPNYQMNAAYIAKLKAEVAALNSDLGQAEANLKSASTPSKVPPTRANTETKVQSTPYDDEGNLNPGWEINQETGEPYYTATFVYKEKPAEVSGPSTGTPYDDGGNLNPGWSLNETGDPVWISAGYNDATGQTIEPQKTASAIQGPAYDDEGNLMPGWSLDEENNPVWIGPGYIDATGETIQPQKTASAIQGPAYDDEGNLMPGWSLDEENNPVWVGNNSDGSVFVEPATQRSAEESRNAAKGLSVAKLNTNSQATQQDVANFKQKEDWRVRLSLAPNANYLYKVQPSSAAGILAPLAATDGVLFPYTPAITVNYAASYEPTDLTHSNYKMFSYKQSSVDQINITCDFTAQDTFEANYLLAVIHFFRSVTKMFYGQDQNPKPGTPPPLCYLSGLGAYQFDAHPIAITSFNYSLPTDVDYIRAGSVASPAGVNKGGETSKDNSFGISALRAVVNGLLPGGKKKPAEFLGSLLNYGTKEPTYVPTKMQIQITAVPIVTRNDISNNFSLTKYGTGELLRGTKRQGGGIW